MANSPIGRRLRISSVRLGSTKGYTTVVHDADTGEPIHGISHIDIYLDVKGGNTAKVTYFDMGDKGGALITDGKVLYKTVEKQDVEIDDLTCFEIMDNIRKDMK
jgi:hypothetical protein